MLACTAALSGCSGDSKDSDAIATTTTATTSAPVRTRMPFLKGTFGTLDRTNKFVKFWQANTV
jgi:hypothetical protein